MNDDHLDLSDTSRTEITERQYNSDGRITSEIITTVVRRHPPDDELPVGMYL